MYGLNLSTRLSINFLKVGLTNPIPELIPVGTEKHQAYLTERVYTAEWAWGLLPLEHLHGMAGD